MLWSVHPETVNLVPLGKRCWFDSSHFHKANSSVAVAQLLHTE